MRFKPGLKVAIILEFKVDLKFTVEISCVDKAYKYNISVFFSP